ncbi:hypothetical protein RhiJN_18229 [Ceratobasidium sp. AG-Ba]|nr:hypothetical protein RhiJN_18229 [Ceratobasidium sp. AG-Ba]
MEWVPMQGGGAPHGRVPVEGGYEGENPLYHAYAEIQGVKVPGKTGRHLCGANVAFGGREMAFESYHVLCWKQEEYY